MDHAIVVSSDGHASMPPHLWPDYLDPQYHHFLPRLKGENELSGRVLWLLNNMVLSPETRAIYDRDRRYANERWSGLWDPEVRLAEMDREGIAAEFVYFGDFRTHDLFFNVMNATYPMDAVDAGAQAYDRWAADTFGTSTDRLLLCGAVGSVIDVGTTVNHLTWLADRKFVGTYAPGFVAYPHLPPLFDEFWDRIWATYADLGLTLVVHAGWGFAQGLVHPLLEEAETRVKGAGGSDLDLVMDLAGGLFNDEGFFRDLTCRRAMWQMMLGGVFDRHPTLRLMMTEVRADWIPAVLSELDSFYDRNRDALPAKRRPSEYWHSNCLAGLSFMHKAEVAMRAEIGVDTIAFGRDYPHTESTWPNTAEYLRLIFAGTPVEDVRKMLGENLVQFLGLDRSHLAKIAKQIGPDLADITASNAAANLSPELIAHLDLRCGVLKDAEGGALMDRLRPMMREDLVLLGVD